MFKQNFGKLNPEQVLKLMETERLDFELFDGQIIGPARIGIEKIRKGRRVFVDGPLMYPEAPDAKRVTGNFERVSAVFCFDTDDKALLDKFRAAIKKNRKLKTKAMDDPFIWPDWLAVLFFGRTLND